MDSKGGSTKLLVKCRSKVNEHLKRGIYDDVMSWSVVVVLKGRTRLFATIIAVVATGSIKSDCWGGGNLIELWRPAIRV